MRKKIAALLPVPETPGHHVSGDESFNDSRDHGLSCHGRTDAMDRVVAYATTSRSAR